MIRSRLSTIALVGLCAVAGAGAQEVSDISAVASALNSTDVPTRDVAATRLLKLVRATPALAGTPEVRDAVVTRANRDVDYINEAYAQGRNLGEEFGERYSAGTVALLELVAKETAQRDPGALRRVTAAMARTAFTRGSDFSKQLASYGEHAVPALREVIASGTQIEQGNAYWVIGRLLGDDAAVRLAFPLSKESRASAKRTLGAGLTRTEPTLQVATLEGIAESGDVSFVPQVQAILSSPASAKRLSTGHLSPGQEASVRGYAQRTLDRLSGKQP